MKTILTALLAFTALPVAAVAQTASVSQPDVATLAGQTAAPSVDATLAASVDPSSKVPPEVKQIQDKWAVIKYQTAESEQEAAITALADEAHQVTKTLGGKPEAEVWEAIVLSTKAGIAGGVGALEDIRAAKTLLEHVIATAPDTLNGSAYTSLGTLYYKAPAWPVSFGDNAKARAYLEQARALNPEGIDPNYFFGDFLLGTGEAKAAIPVFERALAAPARPGREVADAGRRKEIETALAKAKEEVE